MKDVQQKTLSAGVEEIFTMQLERSQFLVKNFTDGNIQVKLGNNEGISIVGSGMFEVVFNNVEDRTTGTAEATNIVKVTASSGGTVEVASVDF